jgi:hypothetical protein
LSTLTGGVNAGTVLSRRRKRIAAANTKVRYIVEVKIPKKPKIRKILNILRHASKTPHFPPAVHQEVFDQVRDRKGRERQESTQEMERKQRATRSQTST